MQETVKINDLTLCHKHSEGWVRSTLPDVCKSPQIPVPYTNMAFARDLADGTTTVLSHGGAMNGVKGSRFAVSIGDEPGSGGGVISGVNRHEATWLSWSPNVFMEGRPVTRLTDKMLMNKGNTVSMGGYFATKPNNPRPEAKKLLDAICDAACNCDERTGSPDGKCVETEVLAWATRNNRTVISEIAWNQFPTNDLNNPVSWEVRTKDGVILKGGGKRPIDFIDFENKVAAEYKGLGDRMRGNQSDNINEIIKQYDLVRDDVNFKKNCKCYDKSNEQIQKNAAKEAVNQQDRSVLGQAMQYASDNPWKTAGIAVGLVVTGGAVYLAAPAAAMFLGGLAVRAAPGLIPLVAAP